MPEFEKFVDERKTDPVFVKKNVSFAKIDSVHNSNLMRQLNIKVYPTIFLFQKNGESKEKYRGHLNMDQFKSWLLKQLKDTRRSPSRLVEKHQIIFDKQREVTPFVLFFGLNPETPEFQTYLAVAAQKVEHVFIHAFQQDIREYYNITEGEQRLYVHNREEDTHKMNKMIQFRGNMTNEKEIIEFVRTFTVSGLVNLESSKYGKMFQRSGPTLFIVFNETIREQLELFRIFYDMRPKFYNKVLMGFLQANSSDTYQSFVRDWGIKYTSQIPCIAYIEPPVAGTTKAKRYFVSDIKFDKDEIWKIYQDFKNGVHEPYYRQEPIPENNTGLIKNVVRANFDLIVNDKKKDVILMFFQPGCHNCQEFQPKYFEAATRLSNNKNIVFAQVNAVANELDEYDIKRYPDVKFYPANDKNPIDVIL